MLQRSPHLTVGVPLGDDVPLVELAAAAGNAYLHLCVVVLDIQPQRHKSKALLRRLSGEVLHLSPVKQQFARSIGLVVVDACLGVGAYVHVHEPQFAVIRLGKGVAKVHPPRSYGLDFSTGEDQPSLHFVQDLVIVEGLTVCNNGLVFSHDALGLTQNLAKVVDCFKQLKVAVGEDGHFVGLRNRHLGLQSLALNERPIRG